MSAHRARYLREMGFTPLWRLRGQKGAVPLESLAPQALAAESPVVPVAVAEEAVTPRPTGMDAVARMDWTALASAVSECRACPLCERRKQAVLGVGDRHAAWMFIGEGPGAEEDERGEPFVGQAGRLLDNMLAAVGLKRGDEVYIANAVKCRPPGNRTPELDEIAACRPYLMRQIELVQPRLLIALGRPAAQTLIGSEIKISAARQRLFSYQGRPVVVTYHPAYLLRNPVDKAKAWADLCFAADAMSQLRTAAAGHPDAQPGSV